MELNQIAESITRVTHAKKIINQPDRRKNSFAEMVLEKYGPPIVRTTRNMVQQTSKEGKKAAKRDSSSTSQSPVRDIIGPDNSEKLINRDSIGEANRPAML